MRKTLPLLAFALFAAPAFAAEYEIGTLEELREFMEAVHVEDFAGDTITLTADIDCEGGRFNTGDPEYPSTFRGTFDGGGHVISNFVHAATGSTQEGFGVAMFDLAETGAAIQNLTLEGSLPGTASGAYAAPFVLAVESPLGLFLDNCHFRGGVTNYYHAAGLVGFASSGTGAVEVPSVVLTNCSVRGEIVSTWVHTAGGLVAKGTGVQAFDCSVEAELHGGRTGGLVGEAYGGSFEGCSFEGTMRPDRETVGNCIQGGLSAETSNTVFRACTSAVGLDSRAAAAGGAVGVTHGSSAFHDCSATVKASNVPGNQNTLGLAGFAASVGSGGLISNCLVKVDWQGVHPDSCVGSALESCQYYGLAHTVSGACIRIVDCTVEGRLAGGTRACGFVGSATLTGGEIARCAVFADVSTLTNRTDGMAAGFAGSLSLSGGAVVRECFSAGTVDAAGDAAGFACEIDLRDDESQVRDCYSTAEVVGGENQNPAGFACRISDSNDEGGVLPVTNCWFGGTVRVRGRTSSDYQPYGFAYSLEGDASLENCAWVAVDGVKEAGTAGATALSQAASRKAASWPGYDFAGTWSISEDETTPYFAWSLSEGTDFRLFAVQEEGKTVTIGESAAPGAEAAVSAVAEDSDLIFCGWTGGATYTSAAVNPSALLADNHRTARCVWGKAITTRAELAAIADDPIGSYALDGEIDLSGEDWTPIGTSSQPFTGSLYGQGHSISGLTFGNTSSGDANSRHAGLFRYAKDATFVGIVLEDVDLDGYQYVGALAGEVQGATTVRDCSASGTVKSSSGCVGMLVGRVYNANGTAFEGCGAEGAVESAGANAGGLVGDIYNSTVSFGDCAADVAVSGTGGNNKGGFAGCIESGGSVSFLDCRAEGDVTAPNSSYVGGFVGNAARPVRCENCQAFGDTSGSSYTGGFVGQAGGGDSVFADCVANGDVTTAETNGLQVGGFVGYANGERSRYENCAASGAVSAGSGGQVGGFVGQSDGAGVAFEDCLACGPEVRTTGSAVGGFAGYVTASNEFTRCTALPSVFGEGAVGGFVGSAEGVNSQYAECKAHGSVKATSYRAGGFAGQSTASGIRYERCTALGGVESSSYEVGGFAGNVSASNDFLRCMAAGSAAGTYNAGGFVGNLSGGGTTVAECFALGDATATRSGDAYAGGFAGCAGAKTAFSDSYSLGTAKGRQVVGGFAGRVSNSGITFERCYAAGAADSAGTWTGGFAGQFQSVGSIVDCASLLPRHAAGTGTAGASGPREGVAELDAAGFLDSDNFHAFLDPDPTPWTQVDGVTQPLLAWSAADGLSVFASVGGTASGAVEGAGQYAPGETVTIRAESADGFFVAWTGSTPYDDPSSPVTTVALDNHRVAAVQFGRYIRTAADLQSVTNDLAGLYRLDADIDLAGVDFTPIGNNATKFTGKFYGFGHSVSNLVCTNNPNSECKGLFGATDGAVLDGITVSGTVQCNAYYYYAGGLVGHATATLVTNCHATAEVEAGRYAGGLVGYVGNGTSILGCSAAGSVKATGNYAYAGGLVGGSDGGTFEIRDCVSSAEVTATAAYVGGFIGYVTGSGASVISGCRADGYAGGHGSVGGFVGYVYSPMTISNCVARGDVRSTGSYYGGFVGYFYNNAATIEDCWCSGAVWGTGGTIGSFVGYLRGNGTIEDCSIYAFGAGPRPFCGSDATFEGGSFSAARIEELTRDWPEVKQHVDGATPISTAEELLAVTNDLAGIYVLTADIDFEGAAIEPIGNSTAFSGEFYGQNYAIRNFVVDSTNQYVGLFGRINGGRVSGVVAEGSVRGAYASSGSSTGTGGFAGLIGSQSLVDGCSFEGAVVNATTYNVGGFVGRTEGAPVILRSSYSGLVVQQANGCSDAGGFAGDHNGGYVMDCYAIADVEAGNNRYAAGFAGNAGGRIATSWCAASVESTGTYRGAFAGYAQTGYVTDCYYDSGKTDLPAVGYGPSYVGISALATEDMLHEASFAGFDFVATWNIDEGESTPYLRTFLVQLTGFTAWLDEWKLPPDTDPLTVTNGIPLLARYVYGIVPMNKQTDNDGNPLVNIGIDGSGKPYFWLPPQKKPDEYGMRYSVLWSRDLVNWQTLGECWFDQDGDGNDATCHPPIDSRETQMFFKYKIVIED